MFGDFDTGMADVESSMVDLLKVAGVLPRRARKRIETMLRPTFVEAYGRTMTDNMNQTKRNSNIK